MMALRPSGAWSPLLARMQSAYRPIINFLDVSNNDRRLRNREEHDGSITVPALASTGD
jgi:hypothetical protein